MVEDQTGYNSTCSMPAAPLEDSDKEVFYCTKRHGCDFQGYVLYKGIAWGRIPGKYDPWRKAHDLACTGELVQGRVV